MQDNGVHWRKSSCLCTYPASQAEHQYREQARICLLNSMVDSFFVEVGSKPYFNALVLVYLTNKSHILEKPQACSTMQSTPMKCNTLHWYSIYSTVLSCTALLCIALWKSGEGVSHLNKFMSHVIFHMSHLEFYILHVIFYIVHFICDILLLKYHIFFVTFHI